MASKELIEAVAVTAELCGRTFSEAAARVFVGDLSAYPEVAVIKALARCRKEVRGVLTVQDVVSRVDDGRPGPNEAWAMLPMSEGETVVWTDEMAQAFGVVREMLGHDRVAACFAFKERYIRAVNDARDAGRPVNWTPTLGHDPQGREQVLAEAVQLGRLPIEYARRFEPLLPAPKSGDMDEITSAVMSALL